MPALSPIAERPVVLITGASSGLGEGMAREFAKRGADLALCARRSDRLATLKAQIEGAHPGTRVEIAALDVADEGSIEPVFQDFHARFGRLDRIIVNAGIGDGVQVGRGGWATNRRVLEINLLAAMAQVECAMGILRAQNAGQLVLVSSMSALRGLRGAISAYSTSKAALAHLGECLAADCLGKPFSVQTLYPGYIATEINADMPRSKTPFIIDADNGCRLMVDAIERGRRRAYVPAWPWAALAPLMRHLPLSWIARLT